MKNIEHSRLAAALLALALILSCVCAQAETVSTQPAADSEVVARLLQVIDFKFFVRENGIGKGTYPVYTAPSTDSIRLADGKAYCDVGSEISVAGHVNGWLMVRYEIKDKKARVGYIPAQYARAFKSDTGKLEFSSIPAQTAEKITITDNPRSNSTPFGTLPADTEITILGKYTYTGNWWYVETHLDGQLTRGFIDRNSAAILVDGTVFHGNAELGCPVKSPEGNEKIGMITINGSADAAMIVRRKADTNSPMVARVYGGDRFPCYAAEKGANGKIWYRIWDDGVWGWFSSGRSTLTEDQ